MATKSENRKRRIGSADYRISVDSIQELKRGIEADTDHFVDDLKKEWEGGEPDARRTLMPGHLMNGLLTWFLGLPQGVRDDILIEGLELYINRLDGDPKSSFVAPAWKMAKTRGAGGYARGNAGDTPKPKGKDVGADADD